MNATEKWQPIESAPEGKPVLLWWTFAGKPIIGRVRGGVVWRGDIIEAIAGGEYRENFPFWMPLPLGPDAEYPAAASDTADVPWQWYSGRNDENFSFGPCDTREEAIRLAVEDGMCEERSADDPEVWENHIHLVEAQSAPLRLADWIGTDTLLERADEAVADSDRICHEHGDGPWFEATPEQEADLAARLCRACDEWQAAHGLTFTCRTFSATRNAEFVIVPQLRELLPAPAAEGGDA
ncbi:hypothetical protein [Paracoccus denitrificans]|uniref:hypothetical protein n=1 Tax=Paracoccus denitrificans TaxID=266 RepID=UPI003364F6A5